MATTDTVKLQVELNQTQWRPLLRPAAKIAISLGVLAWLAYLIDWRQFAVVVAKADVALLVGALLLQVVANLMITLRWQLLLIPVGIKTTYLQALQSYLKGHFAAYFIPSGITGDVVKAVDMHGARQPGEQGRSVELASSIFVERAFGAITVGLAVAVGLSLAPLATEDGDLRGLMFAASAAVVVCSCLAIYADILLQFVPEGLRRRFALIDTITLRTQTALRTYRRQPKLLIATLAQSLVIQILRVLVVIVIARAVGAEGPMFPYFIAVPIIFLSNMIPVVGSRIGSEQGLFVLFLGLAGVDPAEAMAIALMSLIIGVASSLPGGYWIIKGRARPPNDQRTHNSVTQNVAPDRDNLATYIGQEAVRDAQSE